MKLSRVKAVIVLLIPILLSSCATTAAYTDDFITQKATQNGKIQITMSTKYSVYLDEFERATELKFPNLDLVLVGNHTANDSDEYAQRLKNNDLTDIVLTWPLDKAAQNCADNLIDLSGMEFTARYQLSALNNISQDGKLYYLPGPTQVRGIVFNKTMFKENGWQVPEDFDGFIKLCHEIEASGIRSLQLSFWNKEVLRYAFMAFGYSDSFSTSTAAKAISSYNQGDGSLSDFALPALNSFQRLIDEGVLRAEDLDVRYPTREEMLFNRKCAMVSDGISLLPLAEQAGNTDEFAVMPFFCPGNGTWGQLIPTQYIGLNKSLTNPENKEKYNLALQVMDYISTQEGQLALANNNTTMISSLSNTPSPKAPELSYMEEVINAGRCVIFPTLENVDAALYEGLSGLLKGELTTEQAVTLVDTQNKNPIPPIGSPVIGRASETFSLMDTGSYVTDVMRQNAQTDFALFLNNGMDGTFNGKGISAKFYEGEIVESDVTKRVLPVFQQGESGYMEIATITGANLVRVLEHSLDKGDWFYYASGLNMEYSPTATPEDRIKKLTDSQGADIQPDREYTVATLEGSIESKYITSLKTTETLISNLIINDIKEKGTISPVKDGRLIFIK